MNVWTFEAGGEAVVVWERGGRAGTSAPTPFSPSLHTHTLNNARKKLTHP